MMDSNNAQKLPQYVHIDMKGIFHFKIYILSPWLVNIKLRFFSSLLKTTSSESVNKCDGDFVAIFEFNDKMTPLFTSPRPAS